ncbi:MAG: transposase, partial [Deltaproteobacteria bacterium]|nr:transposase [Deltaproteobacteria bacterium]
MPRQARLDAPGTLHHVIARGIERRAIFLGREDYEDFLRRLEAAVTWGQCAIFAWTLLSNHFHLLLRSGEAGLPSVMRRVMTGYAVSFNLRHKRHGHVFQNRYRSIVCEEETYLLELVRYIHLNPLRASVVGSMEELDAFPYCGHSAVLGRVQRPWQEVREILGRFGDTEDQARQRYEAFVRAGVEEGSRPELVGGGLRRSCGAWLERPGRRRGEEQEQLAYDERVLGSPEFVHDILAEADWERRQALRVKIGLDELARRVLSVAGVSERALRSGVKRPDAVAARRAFIQIAVRDYGYSGAAVGRYLGVTASTAQRQASEDK